MPFGWGVENIKKIGRVVTGKTPSSKTPEHFGDSYPFVTPTDFKNYFKVIMNASRGISQEGYDANKARILPSDSLVVTCIGSDMGKVAIAKIECLTNQQINSIIPDIELVSVEYLYLYFTSIYEELRTLAFGGSTMPILNKSDFENIEILLPPSDLVFKATKYLTEYDSKIVSNVNEIQSLTKLRDTLLPKLISGEVRV